MIWFLFPRLSIIKFIDLWGFHRTNTCLSEKKSEQALPFRLLLMQFLVSETDHGDAGFFYELLVSFY